MCQFASSTQFLFVLSLGTHGSKVPRAAEKIFNFPTDNMHDKSFYNCNFTSFCVLSIPTLAITMKANKPTKLPTAVKNSERRTLESRYCSSRNPVNKLPELHLIYIISLSYYLGDKTNPFWKSLSSFFWEKRVFDNWCIQKTCPFIWE